MLYLFEISFPPVCRVLFKSASGFSIGGGAGAWNAVGCLGDICADPPVPVSDFICKYGAYLDSQRFAALCMNGESACVWNIRFRRNRGTAMGAWQMRWLLWGGHGASTCRRVTPTVETAFV